MTSVSPYDQNPNAGVDRKGDAATVPTHGWLCGPCGIDDVDEDSEGDILGTDATNAKPIKRVMSDQLPSQEERVHPRTV